ncbi:MAG: lectin-like protein, partial [Bacteroidota bacterium]
MRKILALAFVLIAFSQVSFAGKIYVRKTNNTADSTPSALTYSTIQAALAAIPNGDTLIIYDGTYPEKINFNQSGSIKRIVIGSRYLINGDKSHISKTIIDAADISQSNEWADAIIAAYDYRANRNDAQIIGITLTGAKRFGLYMAGGTIRACIFKDNGLGYGYTFMRIANTLIDSCTFDGNKSYNLVEATDFSGASNKKTIIRNSVFKNNLQSTNTDGALVSQVWAQDLLVQNSLFYKNKNGHIFSFGGNGAESGTNISNNDSIFVSNSLIYDNEATVANFRTWERRDGGTFYCLNNIINKNTDYFRFRGGDNTYSFGFFNNYIPLDMTRSKQSDLSASAIYTAKNNYESTNKIIFKDTASADYRLADSSFGFALGLDTLAIDTFNVVHKKDFDGNVRPNPSGTKIDLGPFENINAVSIPILTKATAGNSKVYLNWKLYQNTYDSILVYRSTDSSSNSYEKIGAAAKQTTTAASTGQINNESNYIDLGTFGTSRYYLSKTRRSWTNSRSTALTDGADLVTFESKSEYDFVMNEAKKTTGETMWIGLYQKDKNNEPKGSWVWVNGMDMSAGYTLNFGSNYGEPNNSGNNEDWCEARWDYMNDGGNGDRFYVIEIDKSGDNGTVDFTDTTAVNNTKYFYKLKAKITTGDVLSGFSNIKGARPSAGYPLPTNISLMNASRLVKVKWTNPTTEKKGTGSYKIFAGTDSTAVKLMATVSDKDSSYVDSNKVAGKTYYYKLKSVDADGVESDFSKALSVKVTSYVYIATNGTEKGFGSESDPVQTFNQAMTIAADADTVVFSNGTFSFAESQRISKVITIASKYIATNDTNDINNTIITSGNGIGTLFSGNNLSKSFIGLTFQGNPGGVFAMDNVIVENCRFVQNGTYNNRTGRFIGVYNNSKITKSKFLNNYGTIELSGNDLNINDNYFEGNIFANRTNTQVSWFISGWVGKVKIENNIFIKNGEYVKQTWGNENETAVIGIDGWQDTSFVANNTFINNDAAAILFNQRNRSAVVVNNLFYKNKTEFSFLKYESYNNNQFIYSNISNNIISQALNTYPNISSYAYSSHSGNNLINPEFGFKDTLNYRIGNSSAAIGAGVKTIVRNSNTIFTGPSTDYYGNTRSNTKMDIGAEQTSQQFPAPGLKGDAGDTKATLTWNKSNSTISGYNIFKSSSPIPDNATSAYVTINNSDSLILPETSLTNLSKYYYRIQAFDNANNKSGLSNEVLIRPNTVPSKLAAITAAAGPRSATIEWTKKSSIYGYTIFRGFKQDSLVAITGSIDSSYFVDRDIKVNTNYYYGVKVTDSVGVKSEMSNVVLVVPSNLHYVDTSSKIVQNGSKQYPFTNLADAVANTLNGDTVILKKGSLNITETVRYSKSITIASEWVITNDKGDIGATIITSENDIGSLFQKVNSNNFNPRLTVNGINFKKNKSQLFNLDQLTINNCIFEENGEVSTRKRWFVAFQWTDTIQNSIFRGNNGYITLGGGDIVFRNNKFINNLYGATDDPYPLINGWTGKVKFESNYFIGNGIYSQRPWDNLKTDVIRLEGWQDTVIVANNTFINNNAVAVQFLPNQKHAIVVNNLFYGNKSDFNFTNPGNNPAFLYSNISNNFLNTSLEKYQYITSYNYRSNSANNVINGINAFVDTVDFKLSPISGAIGVGAKVFRTNNLQVYTAQGADYFGNAFTDKIDIGAHQTTFAFPAPSLNEVEGGNAKIKVSWLKSSKLIKGYNVYRSESPIAENSNLTPLVTIDKPDSLFIIDAATNGTKYYYRVKAFDSSSTAKFSGFSNELNVIPNIPPAKTEVFSGEAGPRINYLNWSKKDSTYKFTLYRGINRDSLIVIARGLDSIFYVDKNLEVNKEYFYALKVTDKGGAASDLSDILALKTTNIFYVDTLVKSTLGLGTAKRPYMKIQDAVDASLDGDTVLVKPGIYTPFRISNKGIVVRSTDGPVKTLINSNNQSDYYLVRVDGNDNDSRPYKSIQVEGFTISGMKNWRSGDWGAAISIVRNTSPVFKNNIVKDIENYNTISIDQSAPTFINNLFVNNRGNFLNVGWNIDSTSAQYKMPRFINCTFTKIRGWGNNGVNEKGIIPFVNS